MKVGDLVGWKKQQFRDEDIGIVIDIPEYPTANDQFDLGDRMITILWQKRHNFKTLTKIRAHYLEVVSSGREPETR